MWSANIPILKRLVPSLQKRMVKMVWPNGQGVLRREGALFLLNLNTSNDRIILRDGLIEQSQRPYFFENARKRNCDILIDIGANIGLYSLFAALKETHFTTILAYEPNQLCHDRMRANLMLNNLSEKVKTRMAAVSDHNGAVPFIYCPKNNDLFSQVGTNEQSADTVPAVRLDDEVKFTGRNIAIKMDIEGYELTALQGMKELLRNNNCYLQVECWVEKAPSFIAAMKTEGYRLIHQIKEDHYFEKAAP